jgi:hypothetical protein
VSGEAVIGIRLQADGSGFVGAINVSRDALKNLRGETEKIKPAAETSFGGAVKAAKNFLGVVAAGSLTHFIKSINAADASLVSMSQKTGIAVEELSRYDKVSAITGRSMDELADYSVKLGQSLMNAVEKPTSDAARAMKALGFSSEETARLVKHPEEAMKSLAKRMGDFRDGNEKNAVAMALFGKQGKDIVPVLSDIAEHTREVGAVSEEQAAKSKHLETQLALMGVEAKNLGRSFLTGLLPALKDIGESFGDLSDKESTMKTFGEGVGTVFKTLAHGAALFVTGIKNLSVNIASLVEVASAAASFDLDGVRNAWQVRTEMIDENNDALKKQIENIWKSGEAESGAAAAVAEAEKRKAEARAAAEKKRIEFTKNLLEDSDRQVKAAEAFIKRLKEEVEVTGLDEIAKKRLQAANLGVAASAEKYIKQLEDQKKKTEALAGATRLLAFEEKHFNDWLKNVEITSEDLNKIRDKALESSDAHLKKIEQEIMLLGLSNEEREVKIALLEAEKNQVGMTIEEYENYIKTVEEATRRKYTIEQAKKDQEELRREWQKTGDQIKQSFTDAIMHGKGFVDTLKNMFKALVLRPSIEFSVQNGMNMLGMGGDGGGLLSGFGRIFGGLFGGTKAPGGLPNNGIYGPTQDGGNIAPTQNLPVSGASMFSSYLGYAAMIYAMMQQNDKLYQQGWQPSGQYNDIQKELLKHFGISNLLGTGPVLGGVFMNGAIQMGLDKLLQGLGLSGRTASLLTGSALWTRAFGYKKPEMTSGGVQGTLSLGGFEGEMFQDWTAKGGWFRRDKHGTETEAMNREMRQLVNSTIGQVPKQMKELLEGFGQDFNTVFGEDWSKYFKIVLSDKGDWEDVRARLANETARVYRDMATVAVESIREGWGEYVEGLKDLESEGFYDEMGRIILSLNVLDDLKGIQKKIFGVSGLVVENFDELADAGEKIYETISRLAETFTATNRVSKLAGLKFSGVGLDSAATRQALVDDAGGADALMEVTESYWRTFATQSEIFADSKDMLVDAFDAIGVAIPRTVEAYKALVAAQDMSTEEGRKAALQLMQAAGLWQQTAGVFESMKTSLSNSISDIRRAFEFDGLSNEEKYNKLKKEADAAWIELQTATDPEQIQKLLATIQQDMTAAWGLLTDDQKNAKRNEYLRKLDELEAMGLDRIDVAQSEFFGVDVASKNVAEALNALAGHINLVTGKVDEGVSTDIVSTIRDAVDREHVEPSADVLRALRPIMEEAVLNTKPLMLDAAILALKPLLEERGISDDGEMARMLEHALKPLLVDQSGSVDGRHYETLQYVLDRINEEQWEAIDVSGASRELEGAGDKAGQRIENAGAAFEGSVVSVARSVLQVLQTPQVHLFELVTPTIRQVETN